MTKKKTQDSPRRTTSNGDPTSELVLTEEQQDLIERFGVLHDQLGHSPATGRIVGLLLVAPRQALTFDEIREALGLSKSSTSAGLNLLLQIGSVVYFTRPGERRRYFRKNYSDWEKSLLERMDTFFELKDLLLEAHDLKQRDQESPGPEIPRMVNFLEFIHVSLHDAYRKWLQEKTEDCTPALRSERAAKTQ